DHLDPPAPFPGSLAQSTAVGTGLRKLDVAGTGNDGEQAPMTTATVGRRGGLDALDERAMLGGADQAVVDQGRREVVPLPVGHLAQYLDCEPLPGSVFLPGGCALQHRSFIRGRRWSHACTPRRRRETAHIAANPRTNPTGRAIPAVHAAVRRATIGRTGLSN